MTVIFNNTHMFQAYEVFGSVLDVVRDKLPGTAKVISQLTAMEDNVRQSLA